MPPSMSLVDQYAFRPTGSTTAAVVSVLHSTTELLKEHEYVLIISIDYTKAFDSIRTDAVTEALSKLDIPDSITNWLIDYLDNRQHYTIFQGQRSSLAITNASVVQGSVIGPSDFIITTADLQPTNHHNRLLKYADDSYLLIGSKHLGSVHAELLHITAWAKSKIMGSCASSMYALKVLRGERNAYYTPI